MNNQKTIMTLALTRGSQIIEVVAMVIGGVAITPALTRMWDGSRWLYSKSRSNRWQIVHRVSGCTICTGMEKGEAQELAGEIGGWKEWGEFEDPAGFNGKETRWKERLKGKFKEAAAGKKMDRGEGGGLGKCL